VDEAVAWLYDVHPSTVGEWRSVLGYGCYDSPPPEHPPVWAERLNA